MWAWRKQSRPEEQPWRGAARAALESGTHPEIIREAIHAIAGPTRADRVAIWLHHDAPENVDAPDTLRGVVWERDEAQLPAEWQKLSVEPPLPPQLLARGGSVEQELDPAGASPVFGPLIGLHHVLWSPVRSQDRLHGLILTGWHKKPPAVPREVPDAIAAQLALALDLEEQRHLARERESDLRFSKEILAALASGASSDTILSRITASCVELFAVGSGPNLGFAVVGHFPLPAASTAARPEVEFAWDSGDDGWAHAIHQEPLVSLWQESLDTGRMGGIGPPPFWSACGLARLVAIPLANSGQKLGILVVGIPPLSSSLHTLERLELRGSLAFAALERRKLNTERLRTARRRQSFLESSPDATILLDGGGKIAAANHAARSLLESGVDGPSAAASGPAVPPFTVGNPEWYIGGRFAQLFCAREQERVQEWAGRALAVDRRAAGGEAPPVEAELLTGVHVRLRAPLAAGDDLLAVVLDPAAAQENSPQRSHAESELHHVLEWVEEGVLLFGADQRLRGMNTRFGQIAGLSAEEASSSGTLEDLIRLLSRRTAEPESFAVRWRELARSSEGGSREEVQMARPVPRVLERSVRPVLDSAGRRLGRLELYRDLTAQRVFQAKLLQTEKLAALGQMITGVAHELSNPLTTILGYAQRLLVRNDLAGRTTEAQQIYQEAERASAILRQLLLTARESRPERKRVALNQVVQRTMELQRFGSAAEKIRIEVDLDPTLPFVMGDSGQLQQVLMNLIGNARQAITEEGRPGTIRLRTTRTGQHRVQLQVVDDGPGIPAAILARIFDPFFTTKPAGVGTGLGLSIVLSVVREHGGQVHASNSPQGGATFTVELPAAADVQAETGRRMLPGSETDFPLMSALPTSRSRASLVELPPARAGHRGSRVLVVEDEPTVARLIADVLEDEGLRVDVLLDGREALHRAEQELYDLVICDMKMPGMDGQHFYRALAQTQSSLQDRFLFVTGDVLAAQTQEFLERNRIPHVAKPFRVEELTEQIKRLLEARLTRAERAAAGKQTH